MADESASERDNRSAMRALTWSSIFLGLVVAAAHFAWYSIGPKDLGGSDSVQFTYVAVVALAVVGWLSVVGAGLAAAACAVARGWQGTASLAATGWLGAAGLAAGVIALLGGAVLLVLAGSDRLGSDAFDDELIQTWPTFVLCLLAGDWVRRDRAATQTKFTR